MSKLLVFIKNNKEPDTDDDKDLVHGYHKLFKLTNDEFPNCPFEISLPTDQLLKLDLLLLMKHQ
jgi:hypothetical protein